MTALVVVLFAISFFIDSLKNLHGEAVVVSSNKCITAQKIGVNIFRMAKRLNLDLIKRLGKIDQNNINNFFVNKFNDHAKQRIA